MKNDTNEGLVSIRPFNLKKSDYVRMFKENPLPELEIVIVTISIGSTAIIGPTPLRNRLKAGISEVLGVAGNSLDDPQLREELSLNELSWVVDATSAMSMYDFPPSYVVLRSWLVDREYIQVGFRQQGTKYNAIGIAAGMLTYDEMVAKSGSIEPKDHTAPLAVAENVAQYSAWTGDMFAKRDAFWCRALIDLRNRWLVTLRAIAIGRDPHLAYDQFCMAGGKYFLDYPILCP